MMWFDWMILRSSSIARMSRYSIPGDEINELEKEIEVCSCALLKIHLLLQPYTINGAKVAFLNQRPQARPLKGSANNCLTCDRSLQGHYQFCCLSCKVSVSLLSASLSTITLTIFAYISRADLLHGFAYHNLV